MLDTAHSSLFPRLDPCQFSERGGAPVANAFLRVALALLLQ